MFQNRKISYFLIALMMCGGCNASETATTSATVNIFINLAFKSRTPNQLWHQYYWPMYEDNDKSDTLDIDSLFKPTEKQKDKLANFIQAELTDASLLKHQKIQKQFIFWRWIFNHDIQAFDDAFLKEIGKDDAVYKLISHMSKPGLWTDETVTAVLHNLGQIYSQEQLARYVDESKEYTQELKALENTKCQAWTELIEDLPKWPETLNLATNLKDKLSWFTSDIIAIEAKRAMIRALLTKIRKSNPNILTSERYGELTGKVAGSSYASTWREYGRDLINTDKWWEWGNNNGFRAKWKSYTTYLQESIWNSTELKNDTRQDGYLDQVITLFLLFVRDILGLEDKEVGRQRDSLQTHNKGSYDPRTEYQQDITTGYGSTGYSKQDDDGRKGFVNAVKAKLQSLLKTDQSVIQDTARPQISFQINQKEVYYLAELTNAFYQFMSAEMYKSKTGDQALNDDQFKDATIKGSYIQRQEEYNLGYLRQWFVRTRSIHPIISWLFQNYNPHMSQKISLSAAYWYSYCFMSDLRKYHGEGLYNLIAQAFTGLGEVGQKALKFISEWWDSTSTTPS